MLLDLRMEIPVSRSRLISPLLCLTFALPAIASDGPNATGSSDAVVVSQGAAALTLSDVDARLRRVPEDKRAGFMNSPERIEELLSNMLLIRQLAIDARADGLHESADIAAELELAADEILAKHHLERQIASTETPDFSAGAYERYISSPGLYSTPETVTVRHLTVLRDNHGDDAARKKAEALRAQFVAEGGDFEAFVKTHSEEKSAPLAGGLLERLERGKAVGSFEEAAFGLDEPGELSPVVNTRFGYHVIMLLDRQPSVRQPFEQVKPAIEQAMKSEFLARRKKEILDHYRAQALDVSPEMVRSLRTRYIPEDSNVRGASEDPAGAAAPSAGDTAPDAGEPEPSSE